MHTIIGGTLSDLTPGRSFGAVDPNNHSWVLCRVLKKGTGNKTISAMVINGGWTIVFDRETGFLEAGCAALHGLEQDRYRIVHVCEKDLAHDDYQDVMDLMAETCAPAFAREDASILRRAA